MTIQTTQSIHFPLLASDKILVKTLIIQTEVLRAIHDFFSKKGLIQLMPVVLSPITDPLNHPVHEASIDYLGQKLQLTKSMILHKQIAISKLDVKGIYIVSPNIRLEKGEKYLKRDKHLLEFNQLDIELKGSSADDFMALMEELIVFTLSSVKKRCSNEFKELDVDIHIPQVPFKRYSSWELKERFGDAFETEISLREREPFWITDLEREFYDREDPVCKGHYINYDLVYPDGYGEALSGGERDYNYTILLRKLKERHQDPKEFEIYMDLAKYGGLVPSAGGGLGIERLVRFITRRKHIQEVSPFPKIPGKKYYL